MNKENSLWEPSAKQIESTKIHEFKQYVNSKYNKNIVSYKELHQYSIEDIKRFWSDYIEFQKILFKGNSKNVLPVASMPKAKWFPDVKLNYTELLFKNVDKDQPAIIFVKEDVNFRYKKLIWTFGELEQLVHSIMGGLRKMGLKKGDVVAGCLSNTPEAIAIALACAGLGLVWTSGSPDFGLNTIVGRFAQVKPKLCFLQEQYYYAGKTFKSGELKEQIKVSVPEIQNVIVVPYPSEICHDETWFELISKKNDFFGYEALGFQDPMYILYSSGTTGAPKCIVHGVGGVYLQHHKELSLHCDIKSGSRLMYYTTLGWMMWNWQLSALTVGATICLYEGNPGFPDLSAIWRVVSSLEVTHFGTSGKFLETCLKNFKIEDELDFNSLKSVLYTGSPLSAKGYEWVYEHIKKDLHLAGICGGTDIISCFFLGNPTLPVHAGRMQCIGLGVDVVALDSASKPVIGEQGELFCRQALPCMPIYFANDHDGEKYRNAYFDQKPEWWCHGDFIEINTEGEVIVSGRSDATLNPGGVRIGSAEIYGALDMVPNVLGRLAVGWVPVDQSDEAIVLCVVLQKGAVLDEPLEKLIKATIRKACSPRHVPEYVFQVEDIPVTHSGKMVEISVKNILAGKEIKNKSSLANPDSLEQYEKLREKLLAYVKQI